MPAQHGDPIVFNANTGDWQNASATGPSGSALPVVIGDPAGSQVAMVPASGQSVNVDSGTFTGTVLAASQYASGAVSEAIPGYVCAVVFNQGMVNEQIGTLIMSGMSTAGQAVLMTGISADATIQGSTRLGYVVPGTSGYTWNFTTSHLYLQSQLQSALGSGWGFYGTDPDIGGVTGWRLFVNLPGGFDNGFGGGGSSTEFAPEFRFSPLHNGVLFFRGLVTCPGSGNPNGLLITTLPAAYHPHNSCRWPVFSTSSPGNNGYAFLGQSGGISFHGIPTGGAGIIDITGHIHIGP